MNQLFHLDIYKKDKLLVMSFLNQLVQPECGGANPLVATAQKIAMRPSANMPTRQLQQHPSQTVDFSTEFIKKQLQQNPQSHQQQHLSSHQALLVGSSQITSIPSPMMMDSSHHHQMLAGPSHQILMSNLPPLMANMQINKQLMTAGEQLESKYRDDMVANQAIPQTDYEFNSDQKDDIEFWQALSQKYIGPKTYDETDTKQSLKDHTKPLFKIDDYVFDERNPLKDQFEDPFAEGLKKLEIGDITSAALLFEAAVTLKPDDSVAWRYLGTTQAQNEKDNQAIRALNKCLELNGQDQEARLAISVSLANENNQNQACRHLLEWLINHERYKLLGASLETFHKFDDLISEDPFFINSVSKKHYEYVKEKFIAAARMSPNNPDPEVQTSLGVLLNMHGEYLMAVDCFKAALSVRPDDSILWNRLGATLANGNKSDDAVVAYRKALEIYPGSLRSRYNLAISLIHLNTYQEAANQLLQILNLQANAKGSKNTQIRTRSVTSTTIWSTLRTVVTLMNKPEYYPMIDGRDLAECNRVLLVDQDNNK